MKTDQTMKDEENMMQNKYEGTPNYTKNQESKKIEGKISSYNYQSKENRKFEQLKCVKHN